MTTTQRQTGSQTVRPTRVVPTAQQRRLARLPAHAVPHVRRQRRTTPHERAPSPSDRAAAAAVAAGYAIDARQKADGLALLQALPTDSAPLVFFDPQYRSVLDHLSLGNEDARNPRRAALPSLTDDQIRAFVSEIERVLTPSGHLMLWVDKFLLCTGVPRLTEHTDLRCVDMVTWNKMRMGMGHRTRRHTEHLVVFQKTPVRAKGVWTNHSIPDVWHEQVERGGHTHSKPIRLQQALIQATTRMGDLVVDPCAGGFSVLEAAEGTGRRFLGADLNG
ncbi:DNA methyltransferase [Dyella psychrodurans]|uniref:Methyltransferase n=1 Tax=Dyella psychrodurans TaxID=1927960 RepID=A0A370XBU4_9GAMM|nr:DNA methyltransferase [Dyella psychrodurans]RDS85904.1 site-specific DNA-methyltransferase [Dyella psychrodurans]